jgi:hypothetical protein
MTQAAKAERDRLKAHADSADLRLTDLIMGTEIAVAGLDLVLLGVDEYDEPFTTDITVKGEIKKISKPWPELEPNLREQINHEQYKKSLVFAVAEAEDHIASYIRIILRAYPDRLIRGSSGGESLKSVPLIDFIRKDRKDLINSLIQDSINSIMREQPRNYLKYLGQVIGRPLAKEAIDQFCEVCATRDLIVHCQGKINSVYIDKARKLARGSLGDFAVVDEKYFKSSIANVISDVYKDIYAAICAVFGKDEKIDAVLSEI